MSDYEEAWRDPNMTAWAKSVLTEMAPKMKDSALVAQIVPDGEGDVKFWVELGASIMMDKPIVVVAFEGRQIPEKLRLIASEVVLLPEGVNPAASDKLANAFERVGKDPRSRPPLTALEGARAWAEAALLEADDNTSRRGLLISLISGLGVPIRAAQLLDEPEGES